MGCSLTQFAHPTVLLLSLHRMCTVLDLPVDLQIGLCGEWLELIDIAQLDTAFCCKKDRIKFLSLLSCPQIVFTQYIFEHGTSAALWIIKRNVKIQSIVLFSDILRDDDLCLALVPSLCSPALECITLCTYIDSEYDPMNEENICDGVDMFLNSLASSCPNVRSFRIKSESLYFGIVAQSLVKLLSHCKKLRVLELPNCCSGSKAFLCALYGAPCLQTVSMSGGYIKDAVQDIPLDVISKTMVHLNCQNVSFTETGTDLGHICAHFPNLKTLTATGVSNEVLVAIAKDCPLLQDVTICVAESVEDATALLVAQNWPHLRRLGLHLTIEEEEDMYLGHSCFEDGIITIIQNCPQLTYFSAVCRPRIYKERYGDLANSDRCRGNTISKLRALYVDSLSLGGFYQIRSMCQNLCLLAIHHGNPYYINDQTAEDIDARPLEAYLQCINDSSIKVLYIHNCFDLLEEDVACLPALQEVHFSNVYPGLTSGVNILRFVKHCSQLKVLSLRNCFSVPDDFVLPLLDACPSLTSLAIINREKGKVIRLTPSFKMLESLVRRNYPNLVQFIVYCKNFG